MPYSLITPWLSVALLPVHWHKGKNTTSEPLITLFVSTYYKYRLSLNSVLDWYVCKSKGVLCGPLRNTEASMHRGELVTALDKCDILYR